MKITKRQLRKIIKEFNIPNPVQIDDDEELLFQVAVKIKDIMPPDDALGMADEDFRSMVVGIYDDYFDPIGEGWEPYPADLEVIKDHLTIIPEPGDLDYEYFFQEGKGNKARTTKRQPKRITREERDLIEAYNSMSPSGKSIANSIKGKFLRMYPDAKIGIDGRGGFITVNGKKAVDMSQASGRGMTDEEMIEMMHAAYAETHVDDDVGTEARRGSRPGEHKLDFGKGIGTYNYRNEGAKVKITKRQLRKIIREEVNRLNETRPRHGIDPREFGQKMIYLRDGRSGIVVTVTSDIILLKSGEQIIPGQVDWAKTNRA